MSSKTTIVINEEIRKSFTNGNQNRISSREKADFRLKKFQGPKNGFGVSTLCAGTVFGLSGLKD